MRFLALLVALILSIPLFSQTEGIDFPLYPYSIQMDTLGFSTQELLDTVPAVLLVSDTSAQKGWPIYSVRPDPTGITHDTISIYYTKYYNPSVSWEYGYAVYKRQPFNQFNIVYDHTGQRITYYNEFKCYLDKDKNPYPLTKVVWMSQTR